ncbi:LysM peptidoglycan-binding domain-containing protein [Limosilactobacillus sp.]|uniref:aggregation-promoting factor n=1 Tax=Limosilactobacillus sp. TaxID=2773925 RepID=UPI00345EA3F7
MKFTKKAFKLTAAIAGAVALGTAATVTTANADTIYTVQAGDTLSAISYKFFGNLNNVDQIAQKNNIANKNLIHVGDKLVIMDDGQIAPATASQIANLPAANQTTTQNQAATTTSNTQSAASASTNNTAASNNSAATTQASASTNNAATTQARSSYNTSATTPAAASYNNTVTTPAAASYSSSSNSSYTSSVSGNDASAKAWIAARESGGSYTARNGQYVGKYQLSASYLNGDYSAANQERVADQYVASRYGSWTNAQSFWQSHGWY